MTEEALAADEYDATGDCTRLDVVQAQIRLRFDDKAMAALAVDAMAARVGCEVKRARQDVAARAAANVRLLIHDRPDRLSGMWKRDASGLVVARYDADDDVTDDDDGAFDTTGRSLTRAVVGDCARELVLKEHQREGVEFILSRARRSNGSILAFSMGLGKTLTTLAFLSQWEHEKEHTLRSVILCPASVVSNWRAEHTLYTGAFEFRCHSPIVARSAAASTIAAWLQDGGLLILSFDMLLSLCKSHRHADIRATLYQYADVLVLDELHCLKNTESARTRAALGFCTTVRIGLTGTPLQNSGSDYFHIVELVAPGTFGMPLAEFQRMFAAPMLSAQFLDASATVKQRGQERTAVLRSLLREVVMHKSCAVLKKELQPKTEFMLVYTYSPAAASQLSQVDLRGEYLCAQSRVDVILRETKVCLIERMLAANPTGESVLVFSEHPGTLRLLCGRLAGRAQIVDGSTVVSKRHSIIESFARGAFDVLLLSLGAGAVGINCQRASRVFLLDPSENPTRDTQAICRAWRLGQKHAVTVYRLAALDTVDMRVMRRGIVKVNMARSVFESECAHGLISRRDAGGDDSSGTALSSINACPDPSVRAMGAAFVGWAYYDSFFADAEADTTSEWSCVNAYHIVQNQRPRGHVFEDGTFVTARDDAVRVEHKSRVVLVAPLIPIIQCDSGTTVVVLSPVHQLDARYEVEVRGQGGEWVAMGQSAHRLFRKRKHVGDAYSVIQVRSRIVDAQLGVSPWSKPSAFFSL